MGLRGRVSSIIAFLRAGYPSDAPPTGYIPLLALLPRRLSDDEAARIATKLFWHKRRLFDRADVGVEITRLTDRMPSIEDIERVEHRLDAMG
jgi:hypothetical protein